MNKKTIFRLSIILACGLSTLVCSATKTRDYSMDSHTARSPSPVARAQAVVSPSPTTSPTIINSDIRSADFNHIPYRDVPDYSGPTAKHITLKAGEGRPSYVNFGDVNGDGLEEAMVVLSIANRGSAILHYVYVFSWERQQPKLLWAFETGDRADGGLRNVYAEKGQLVIELFGKDRVIGGQLFRGDEGLCCPSSLTKTRYRWTGKDFVQLSTEVLKNPSGDANPVMQKYSD